MTKVETTVAAFTQPSGKPGFTLRIPKEARCLFPPHKVKFQITSRYNIVDQVWVSKSHSPMILHIHVTGTNWWKTLKPKVGVGGTVVIEVKESGGQITYRFA